MRKKIKIGVVGLGNFGNDFMALFVGHPDVAEVAVCDRIEERIEATKAAHGLTRSYTDYDEMLKAKDIDCVAIFTQRHLHAPMVLKALEAGKHVYSAVPIACSIEEIRQIIEIIKSYDYLDRVTFISFYYENLLFVRNLEPNQSAQYLEKALTHQLIRRVAADKLDVDIKHTGLTPEAIQEAHEAGIKVNCWTVDDPEIAEKLASWGVDYITTNILE